MTKTKYSPFAFIDLIKFVSIVLICIFTHMSSKVAICGSIPKALLEIPAAFVGLFFVASGMFFYHRYYSKMYDGELKELTFFKKRILRIYPPVILSTVFCVIITMFVVKKPYFNFLSFITTITIGTDSIISNQNGNTYNGALWYIGVLMFCYLIATIILLINKALKTKSLILYSVPMFVGFSILFIPTTDAPFYNNIVCRGYLAFFIGIFLMKYLYTFSTYSSKKQIVVRIICFVLCTTFMVLSILNYTNKNVNIVGFSRSIFVIFVCVPLIILLYDLKPVDSFLSNKVISFCGGMSFIMYVFNAPIHNLYLALDNTYAWINSIGYWYILFDFVVHLLVSLLLYILFYRRDLIPFKRRMLKF